MCWLSWFCWYINTAYYWYRSVPSVLWRCWLGGRKGIWPVKDWVVRCWHGYLSGARCIWSSGCHCHSLSLASVKSWLVLPFWYRPTRVVPDKGPLNACAHVCDYWDRWLYDCVVCWWLLDGRRYGICSCWLEGWTSSVELQLRNVLQDFSAF